MVCLVSEVSERDGRAFCIPMNQSTSKLTNQLIYREIEKFLNLSPQYNMVPTRT